MGINHKRDWFIMGHEYGLFPYEDSKFEASDLEGSEQFGHVAKPKEGLNIQVKYDSDELVDP